MPSADDAPARCRKSHLAESGQHGTSQNDRGAHDGRQFTVYISRLQHARINFENRILSLHFGAELLEYRGDSIDIASMRYILQFDRAVEQHRSSKGFQRSVLGAIDFDRARKRLLACQALDDK